MPDPQCGDRGEIPAGTLFDLVEQRCDLLAIDGRGEHPRYRLACARGDRRGCLLAIWRTSGGGRCLVCRDGAVLDILRKDRRRTRHGKDHVHTSALLRHLDDRVMADEALGNICAG